MSTNNFKEGQISAQVDLSPVMRKPNFRILHMQLYRLISAFVSLCIDFIIPVISTSEISSL